MAVNLLLQVGPDGLADMAEREGVPPGSTLH